MTNTPTLPASKEAEAEPLPELWALCYLHDWDPPKEGQEHRWEPGKNVFPEIHAFYRTWQEAEAIKRDMGAGANQYWVVRARAENEARLRRALTAPAGDGVPGMVVVNVEPNDDQIRQLFSMNSALPRTTEEAVAVYRAILNCASTAGGGQ